MTASHNRFLVLLYGLISLNLVGDTPQARILAEGYNAALTEEIKQHWELGRGLDERHAFRVLREEADSAGGAFTWTQQHFQGVRVLGGELILHRSRSGKVATAADALVRNFSLDTVPTLQASEAMAIAHIRVAPRAEYTAPPTAELVVYPIRRLLPRAGIVNPRNAADFEEVIVRHELAYLVHVEIEQGEDTRHEDLLVHANTGEVLQRWSSLHSVTQEGVGKSEDSGTVKLSANSVPAGFELRDLLRAGNYTADMSNSTSGNGFIYTSAVNEWGDGANHLPGTSGNSPNGQTAAVDAHFGMQVTWDFLAHVLGRNGIDGKGRPVFNRVHYSVDYDNAFWSDACFCMTFGDGSAFKTLTSVDVAAHEMAHGVTSSTANLAYYGESGGLNEATSDILGTMVEFYARGASGQGPVVPDTGGNWTMGEQLATARYPNPLRYMYKPSLDGRSLDAWSPSLASLDVHFSSGPMNRAFYFLSQGASADAASTYQSAYLPAGMKGLGNDKATRIWWRTLTTRLTSTSNYLAARAGAIAAASELYGAGGPEEAAVWNAFAAINVGQPWTSPTADKTAPTVSATATVVSGTFTLTAIATDNVGVTKVDYFVDGAPKGSATQSPFTFAFSATTLANGSHSLVAKAYDAAGNVGTSAPVLFTVDTTPPTVSTKVVGISGNIAFTATASDNVKVTKVDYCVDGTLRGSAATSPFSFIFNSGTVADGYHSLVAKAYDAAGNSGTSAALTFLSNNRDITTPSVLAKVAATAAALTFTATASDNVGVIRVDYYLDGTLKGSATGSPYTLTCSTVTLANGAHSLLARAFDAAGNVGTSSTVTFTVDKLSPVVSTRVQGASGTLTFAATATDNVAVTKVEYLVDGGLKGSASLAPYTLAFNSATLVNGTHSLIARAYDTVGNIGTSAAVYFLVDNRDITAPTVVAKVVGVADSFTFTATATDNVGVARVDYLVDGTLRGSVTSSPYTFTCTGLTNGTHSLLAKAYDAAGNMGASAPVAFIVDTTPPTVSGKVTGSSGTLTFTATTADNVGVTKVEYYVDGALKGSSTLLPYTLAFNSTTLADGDHSLVAKAYDLAGNVGLSAPAAFKVSNNLASSSLTEVEMNDTVATANKASTATTTIRGALATGLDLDTYAIPLVAGQGIQLTLTAPAGLAYGLRLVSQTPQAIWVQVYSLTGQGNSNPYTIALVRR